jgi:hypothetical protein
MRNAWSGYLVETVPTFAGSGSVAGEVKKATSSNADVSSPIPGPHRPVSHRDLP